MSAVGRELEPGATAPCGGGGSVTASAASHPQRYTFGHAGQHLEAAGFEVLPVEGKAPTFPEWTTPRPVALHLPHRANCNVGMLTRRNPVVDIDVRHVELAEALALMTRNVAGDAPERIGASPKRALIYRAVVPFRKVTTPDFALPGDLPGEKAHKVEVLGDGQQAVVLGIHPETSREYFYVHDHILDLEWYDLPILTEEHAREIVRRATKMILMAGGTPRSSGSGFWKPNRPWKPGPAPRQVRGMDEARAVLTALCRIDPSTLDYDQWVRIAYGLKAAFGETGREIWVKWSSQSVKNVPSTTAATWRWVRPERAGWRYLVRLAEGSSHA
jgi:hypothetical protein